VLVYFYGFPNNKKLLIELFAKIDNFLGFKELNEGEEGIKRLREEVRGGRYVRLNDITEMCLL